MQLSLFEYLITQDLPVAGGPWVICTNRDTWKKEQQNTVSKKVAKPQFWQMYLIQCGRKGTTPVSVSFKLKKKKNTCTTSLS